MIWHLSTREATFGATEKDRAGSRVPVAFSHWLAGRLRGDVKGVFGAAARAKNTLKNHLLLRENFQDGEVKAA